MQCHEKKIDLFDFMSFLPGILGLNFSTFWNQFCSQCFSKDNHGDGWRDNRSLINSIYSAEVNLITKFEARWVFSPSPKPINRQSETHQGFILYRVEINFVNMWKIKPVLPILLPSRHHWSDMPQRQQTTTRCVHIL